MQQVWGGAGCSFPSPPRMPQSRRGEEGNLGQEEERGPWGGKLGQMGWELWEHGALLRAAPGGSTSMGRGGEAGGVPRQGTG